MRNKDIIGWCDESLGLKVVDVYKTKGAQVLTALPSDLDSWGWQFYEIVKVFGYDNVHTDQYEDGKVIIEISI